MKSSASASNAHSRKPDYQDLAAMRAALERLAPLTDAAWEELAVTLWERDLAAGDLLLQVGSLAKNIVFVTEGSLREFFMTREGLEYNKAFVVPGQFSGSLYDLLHGGPSTASIQALRDSRLICGSFDQLRSLFDRHPCWERLGRRFAEALFMKKAQREHEFLTMSATERYQRLLQQHPNVEQLVPQYHIASYLGITPVALSRLRRQLRQRAAP